MSMLLLQSFLLMLAAFVLGATTACIVKRTLHGFAGDSDEPAETAQIHIDRGVPPPVTPIPVRTASSGEVTADDTRRFERALKGDVAEAAAVAHAAARLGPVVEVQRVPAPPARPAAPAVADVRVVPISVPTAPAPVQVEQSPARDERSYAAIAVASHDGSTLPPETLRSVTLPAPRMPGPAPVPLPVPRVSIASVPRPADAPPDPEINYVATALAATGGFVPRPDEPEDAGFTFSFYDEAGQFQAPPSGDDWTYAAIAVASHDGSTLAPEGVQLASLPPPRMPEPAPAPLPVPLVSVATVPRPADAPPDPEINYVTTALAATGGYAGRLAEPEVAEFAVSSYDAAAPFEHPPTGESYATVAAVSVSPTTPASGEATVSDHTEIMMATAALAAAAGLAAKRASFQQPLAPSSQPHDDLTRIQGIDEVIASRLEHAGVTRFEQIANWTADDVGRISQALGFFGRIESEYWIDQARVLSGTVGGGDEPPPAQVVSLRSGSSNAAEVATAAAAAAAAAMAASSASRRRARADNEGQEEGGGDDGSHALSRSDLTGLRSVRSEALVGDATEFVRGDVDDLKRIRGIGVLIEKKLNSLGVTSYEQVANWSGADIDRISDILDFKGRIERENWIEQARILASGGQTEFSRRVDKGEA